jgi:hypothetical protein
MGGHVTALELDQTKRLKIRTKDLKDWWILRFKREMLYEK